MAALVRWSGAASGAKYVGCVVATAWLDVLVWWRETRRGGETSRMALNTRGWQLQVQYSPLMSNQRRLALNLPCTPTPFATLSNLVIALAPITRTSFEMCSPLVYHVKSTTSVSRLLYVRLRGGDTFRTDEPEERLSLSLP